MQRSKTKHPLRKAAAILLAAILMGSAMPTALAATAADAGGSASPDTTPRRIAVMQNDPVTGEFGVTDGMELHELNLAFQDLCAKMLADKALFNQQDYFPETASELYTASYISTKTRVIKPDSSDTRPDEQSEGVVTAYDDYVMRIFTIADDDTIHERTIHKLTKLVTTYYFNENNEYKNKTESAYVEQSVTTATLDPTEDQVVLGTFSVSGNYAPTGNQYVKSVGGVSTQLFLKKFTREYLDATAASSGQIVSDADVYDGDSTTAGFPVFGLETQWKATYSYGGTGCYIDLGAYYVITDAVFGTSTGTATADIQFGDPGNWVSVFQLNGAPGYKRLTGVNFESLPQLEIDVPAEYAYDPANPATHAYKNATRYVRVDGNSGNIMELALYGYKAYDLTDYDQGKNGPSYYMEHNATDFSSYDAATSTYEKGKLAQMLDTHSAGEGGTYNPAGYLAYVAANSKTLSGKLSAGNAFGANIIFINPLESMKYLGNVREFVSTFQIIDQYGRNRYQYFGSQNQDNYDALYGNYHSMGLDILPCLQFSSQWFSNSSIFTAYENTRNWKPLDVLVKSSVNANGKLNASDATIAPGINEGDAVSYARHANFMYNYSARYGRNTGVDLDTLTLATGIVNTSGTYDEEAKAGLGYVVAMENANEQNKNWGGEMSYYSAAAYAALCSADYDGSEGRIFVDADGNGYELINDGVSNIMFVDGEAVGTLSGYDVTLLPTVSLVQVPAYYDQHQNKYDVDTLAGIARINNVVIGAFAAGENGAGVITKPDGSTVNVTLGAVNYKLQTAAGKQVGDYHASTISEQGTLRVKPTGIKTADSTMKLATGGFLPNTCVQYLTQMKDWFDYNRDDGYFAVDVINFHTYINTSSYEDAEKTSALIDEIVAWVNKNAPGREIWISEYDNDTMDLCLVQKIETSTTAEDGTVTWSTYDGSIDGLTFGDKVDQINEDGSVGAYHYYAPAENGEQYRISLWGGLVDKENGVDLDGLDKYSAPYLSVQTHQYDNRLYQLAKAQRLLRTSLIMLAGGVDRLSMFELYDSESGVYSNSGLTMFAGSDNKKLAWYYYSTARQVLANAKMDKTHSGKQTLLLAPQGSAVDTDTVVISPSKTATGQGWQYNTAQYADHTKIVRKYYDAGLSGDHPLDVYTYRYQDETTNDVIYAVWAGTDEQAVIKNYTLDLSDCGLTDYHVTAITPEFGVPEGRRTGLTVNADGSVIFDVTETVTFLKVTGNSRDAEGNITNYDALATGMIYPQQLQIGDISYGKTKAYYDGNEIASLFSADQSGNLQKNDLFYKNDLKDTYLNGVGILEQLDAMTEIAGASPTALSESFVDAALVEAIAMADQNAASIAQAQTLSANTTNIAYNQLGGWRANQRAAAEAAADAVAAAVNASGAVTAATTPAQARAATATLFPLIATARTAIAGAQAQAVTSVVNEANKTLNALLSAPLVNVLEVEAAANDAQSAAAAAKTAIQNAIALVQSGDMTGASTAIHAAETAAGAAAAAAERASAAAGVANSILKEDSSYIASLKANNTKNNVQRAFEQFQSVAAVTEAKNIAARITNLVNASNTVTGNLKDLKSAVDTALQKVVSNTAKLSTYASQAAYAAGLTTNYTTLAAAALCQRNGGVYYDPASDAVAGAGAGQTVINDYLLSQFAKLFDDGAENVPQYADDILRYYKTDGTFGTKYLQVPESRTTLIPLYTNTTEYDNPATGANEGYDLFVTFDDYYLLDAANLYYGAGNGTLKVFDASETGTGALLATFSPGNTLAQWERSYSDSSLPANVKAQFEEAAKTTATNKIRIVWYHGGLEVGELALYGHKAFSRAGHDVTPVPGTVDTERDRLAVLNLNTQCELTSDPITLLIPYGQTSTTLAAQNKTLPTYSDRQVTDPETGLTVTYAFGGWYTDAACSAGNEFTESSPITESTTVYAKWSEVAPYSQIALYPAMLSTTDTGFYRTSIYNLIDEQDLSSTVSSGSLGVTCFIDLGREYHLQQISVFNGYGNGTISIYASDDGVTYDIPVWIDADMSYFGDWKHAYLALNAATENLTARYLKVVQAANINELVLYGEPAQPVTDTFTLTFDTGVATVPNPSPIGNIAWGGTAALPTPTRQGYTFEGWYIYNTASFNVPFTSSTPVTYDISLYAKWTAAENFTLTYISDGAVYKTVTGLTSGDTFTLEKPIAAGKVMAGWYTDAALTNLFTANTITQDTTLYAKWIPQIVMDASMLVGSDYNAGLANMFDAQASDLNTAGAVAGYADVRKGTHGNNVTIIDLGAEYHIEEIVVHTSWSSIGKPITFGIGDTVDTIVDSPAQSIAINNAQNYFSVDLTGRYLKLTFNESVQELYIYGSPVAQ